MAEQHRPPPEDARNGGPRPKKPLSEMAVKTLSQVQLETVLLAYLMREPRTGQDLMDNIHRDSGVLFSPGRVYPALARLVKQGLLTQVRGGRRIVYRPANPATLRKCVETRLTESASLIEFVKSLYQDGSQKC